MAHARSSAEARAERLNSWAAARRPIVTPSLLNCDFSRVHEEMDALIPLGITAVHLDVMDGHFVPNLSYGAPIAADWRKRSDFMFDTHLMMTDPGKYVGDFVKAGSDSILFHIEAVPEPSALLREIKQSGCLAGLVLNPPTPVSAVTPYLDEVDAILVMSVQPGFGGQKFQPAVLEKVRAIRQARPNLEISIDGGINPQTVSEAVAAGVTQLVVGSALFRPDGDYATALAELAEGIRRGSIRGGVSA